MFHKEGWLFGKTGPFRETHIFICFSKFKLDEMGKVQKPVLI